MNQLFIAGHWQTPSSHDSIPVFAPATGEQYASIGRGQAADIDLAVRAARQALDGEWGRISATERGRLLTRIGLKVLAHIDELAAIEAKDTGKPLALARKDIEALARYFEFYGGAADKVHGQVIPYLPGYSVSVQREPFGVVGYIFRKLDIPKAPLLFGLILGHTLEQSFRQALTISNGDPTVFFRSPIAAGLLCCAAIMVGASVWRKRRPVQELQQAEERIAEQRLAEERR